MIFTELPFATQQELYFNAAQAVLAAHAITPDSIEPLTFINNATYRVQQRERQWALRLYRPRQSSGRAIHSELAWLHAINAQTTLRVPQPQTTPNGEILLRTRNFSDDAIYGALFDWITGESLVPSSHTPDLAHKIGVVVGTLHQHSQHFSATGTYPRRKLTADQFVFWRLIEAFTPQIFTHEHHAIFRKLEARIHTVFARFQPQDYGLIHGDLIWKNILVNDAAVYLIDFESCGWGFYPYDLAPLLLNYWVEPHYAELRSALLAGYRSIQPLDLDNAELDVLIAARHCLSCAWVVRHLDHPDIGTNAPAIIAQRLREIEQLVAIR